MKERRPVVGGGVDMGVADVFRALQTVQRGSGHAYHSRKPLGGGEWAVVGNGGTHEGHEGSWGIEGAEEGTGS